MSAIPNRDEALTLKSITVDVTLPPRLARRLRALSYDKKASPNQVATCLLAAQLVHNDDERRRLVELDAVHDVGSDRDD